MTPIGPLESGLEFRKRGKKEGKKEDPDPDDPRMRGKKMRWVERRGTETSYICLHVARRGEKKYTQVCESVCRDRKESKRIAKAKEI